MSAENSDSTDDDLSNSGESTLSTDKEPVSPGHNPTFSGLPGQVVELVVEKWVQNGLGISHKENHIFFVHGAERCTGNWNVFIAFFQHFKDSL